MALELTDNTLWATSGNFVEPIIALEIDGLTTIYTSATVKEGTAPSLTAVADQEVLISLTDGTSSEIKQTLNLDKGLGETVPNLKIALVDKNLMASQLISPGVKVTDILGRKAKIWLGFENLSYKDDYILIFRGVIDDVEARQGFVLLNVSSPESKKRSTIFPKASTTLSGALNNSATSFNVQSTSDFLVPYTGPNGAIDTTLKLYVRIDDEIIRYEGTTSTSFTSCTRGSLGTTAASHNDGATIDSFYVIESDAMDLALKLLLSGTSGNYVTNIDVGNFNVDGTNTVFIAENVPLEYNPTVGDFITTSGASNGANNVTNKVITAITETTGGYYLTISGVTFVLENPTSAVLSFRSQYDTWGNNAGCGLAGFEVDVSSHLDAERKYYSGTNLRIYIKDTIENAQEFISEQIYNPISAFSIPRKSQASVGVHTGPVPGTNLVTIDNTVVTNANKIGLKRSVSKNFYNTIIYKLDEDALEERFKSGVVTIDSTSIAQIPVGNKSLNIESKGLRSDLSGVNIATLASQRRLTKYKYGAELISNLETKFSFGFPVEIGDKIYVDMASLKLTDINTATRAGEIRLFEVINKRLNFLKGKVILDLLDTNFNLLVRYGLIGPASVVQSGSSQTVFTIQASYNTDQFGANEYLKWEPYIGAFVKVHSPDFTTSGTSYIASLAGNVVTLTTNLGFTPAAGYIMELGDYDNQTADVKFSYAFQSDGANDFADGDGPYQMS